MNDSPSDKQFRDPVGGRDPSFPFQMQRPEPHLPPSEIPDNRPVHRRSPIRDPWRHILLMNLRTFLIVAAGMSVFFMLAMFTSTRVWQAKEARATNAKPALAATRPTPSPSRVQPPLYVETPDWEFRGSDTRKADSDAIHEALLLAKRADSLVDSGNTREAIALYMEALSTWPNLTAARIKLGRIFLAMRDYLRAQEYLETAVDSDPTSPDLMNDLGVAYFHQRRVTTAMKQFKSAIQIDNQFAPAYFNLALCHLSMADQDSARDYLHKYLTLVPDDTRALKQKAFLDASDGDYTNAMSTLQRAILLDSNWPALRFDAAATAALMGRGDDAIVHLQKAETLASPSAVYLVYQQPAFRDVRLSEPGRAYLKELVERARKRSDPTESYNPLRDVIEPILSNPTSPSISQPASEPAQEE